MSLRLSPFLLTAVAVAIATPAAPLRAAAAGAELDPVEVTATRVAETVDASLAGVSVITRADIEASAASDLVALLRLQAGIDVARSGGPGEQTSVFLRGTNANHVLVLIDGVRVASANTGAFAFENLPLDAIERIEIVRGPRASYWGSDAIGGVIQVFTRRLDAAHVAASYGSYRDAAGSVGFGRWSDGGGFSAQFGARHVGGFSATNPGICNGPDDPYCIYNPDDNGFHIRDAVLRGEYRVGTQTVAASAFRSQGGESFDNGSFGAGYSSTVDQAIGTSLEGPLTPDWSHRLALGSAREDVATPAFGSTFRSTREQVSWVNRIALGPAQTLVAGGDYVRARGVVGDSTGFGAPYDVARHDTGAFAGWRAAAGALDGEVAARWDHDDGFGSAFSGSAALGWNAGDSVRLTGSIGSAYRAPNLNELYSPGYGGYFAGNPALAPERSRSVEFGIDWRVGGRQRIEARLFSTRIRDLVDFSGGDTYQAINLDRAAIDGAELTHRLQAGAWSVETTATLQNPRNRDSGETLLRRPKRKLSNVVTLALGERAELGLEVIASSRAADVGATTLGGYGLLNLRASWALGDAWKFGLRGENLLDRDYALVRGYNTPGRSAWLTATWQPR